MPVGWFTVHLYHIYKVMDYCRPRPFSMLAFHGTMIQTGCLWTPSILMLRLQLQHDSARGVWNDVMRVEISWMGLVTLWKGKAQLPPSHQQKLQQEGGGPQSMRGFLPNLSLPSIWQSCGRGTSWHSVVQSALNSLSRRYWLGQALHLCHGISVFISHAANPEEHPVSKHHLSSTLTRRVLEGFTGQTSVEQT